jgi:hypothetical protein
VTEADIAALPLAERVAWLYFACTAMSEQARAQMEQDIALGDEHPYWFTAGQLAATSWVAALLRRIMGPRKE